MSMTPLVLRYRLALCLQYYRYVRGCISSIALLASPYRHALRLWAFAVSRKRFRMTGSGDSPRLAQTLEVSL